MNSNFQLIQTANNNQFNVFSHKLGAGGFGQVYLGHFINLDQPVAVKYIKKTKVSCWTSYYNRKIPTEVFLMLQVNQHPNVIKLYDFVESQNYFILFIEKPANSIDLFDYISNELVLTEARARNFFHQILNSVEYCLQQGVVHRDIKDENFIIDLDSMTLKLIDFGAGIYLKNQETAGKNYGYGMDAINVKKLNQIYTEYDGTKVYSPPEWISRREYKLMPLTVWSLGILLFDMVQGNIPYESGTEIVKNKLSFRRQVISADCQNLIRKMLCSSEINRIDLEGVKSHSWCFRDTAISSRTRSRTISKYVNDSPRFPIAH